MKRVGLKRSYNKAAPADKAVSFQDMYMHNADGDMETLLDIYKPEEREVSESGCIQRSGWRCWTAARWCACVRTVRLWWATRRGATSRPCCVTTSTTTSTTALARCVCPSPRLRVGEGAKCELGFINSKDDFYVNGNGIATMETTNAIFDEKLYKACVPESVPSFIVAIFRLSHTALAAEQQAGADPAGVGGDVLAVEQRHLQQPGSFSA